MFKRDDAIICLNPDGTTGLTGIVLEDPSDHTPQYLTMWAFCDPDLTNWDVMRGAWEMDRCVLHPQPDLVWASYSAAVLLGKANNES